MSSVLIITQSAQTQQNKTRPTHQRKRQVSNSIQLFLSIILKINYVHFYWVSTKTTPRVELSQYFIKLININMLNIK